jgi:hypothetical protein
MGTFGNSANTSSNRGMRVSSGYAGSTKDLTDFYLDLFKGGRSL